ncbi:MAG: 5'/3'-nucleotidase SurE [Chlorobi bacterium]|nr:5'/3'-nucleotidase SurE [Chlorobiota bacterium]MCI0716009.1 5'/3'-nucleotidase SurE [Chlorobiota bacterium]
MKTKPNVLVSNDDGIEAPGLARLVEELETFANVYVSAPYRQQSAVGHSITIFYPLRVYEHYKNGKLFGMAVEGTPADAVKIGVMNFFKDVKFDLVISGINHGTNTAINIIYSGTVSAATEGTLLGIPSIAISLATYSKVDFKTASKVAGKIVRKILEDEDLKIHKGTLLNINIPNAEENEIKGVKITKQGKSYWEDDFEIRSDPNGRDYFWLTGRMVITDETNDFDIIAVSDNYVSITPLHYDLTDYHSYEEIKNWKIEL